MTRCLKPVKELCSTAEELRLRHGTQHLLIERILPNDRLTDELQYGCQFSPSFEPVRQNAVVQSVEDFGEVEKNMDSARFYGIKSRHTDVPIQPLLDVSEDTELSSSDDENMPEARIHPDPSASHTDSDDNADPDELVDP
ncbi:unnamed protein product [Dicrocoelium dendriticum]|nr:unnamed protein product [Dicrocoelium dendriticum]